MTGARILEALRRAVPLPPHQEIYKASEPYAFEADLYRPPEASVCPVCGRILGPGELVRTIALRLRGSRWAGKSYRKVHVGCSA